MRSVRRMDFLTPAHWLAIWLVEIVFEAVSTSVVMVAIEVFSRFREHLLLVGDASSAFEGIPVLTILVLLYFALTGYLITTAIASVTLRGRGRWVYPSVVALLYLAHSTLFFAGLGNSIFVRRTNVIQLCGAAASFGCAYFGKILLRRWNPDAPSSERVLTTLIGE